VKDDIVELGLSLREFVGC